MINEWAVHLSKYYSPFGHRIIQIAKNINLIEHIWPSLSKVQSNSQLRYRFKCNNQNAQKWQKLQTSCTTTDPDFKKILEITTSKIPEPLRCTMQTVNVTPTVPKAESVTFS